MKIIFALLLVVFSLALQGFINSLVSYNLALFLALGVVVYFLYNKPVGLVVIYLQAVVMDLIYSLSLPINLLTLLLVHFIWSKVVIKRLTLLTFGAKIFGLSFWLIGYFLIHWCLAWLPYYLGDQVMYPHWLYLLDYLLNFILTYLITLTVFAPSYWLINKFFYLNNVTR